MKSTKQSPSVLLTLNRILPALTGGLLLFSGTALRAQTNSILDLGTLGGASSSPNGINNNGQVCGSAYTTNGEQHAFLYTNGTMIDLGTLGGSFASGSAINNSGQVAGESYTPGNSSSSTHAFLYTSGALQDLGTLGGSYSEADAMNDSGWVVGASYTAGNALNPFLYTNGVMYDLGTLGGDWGAASGVNNKGQVSGVAYTANVEEHAFLYTSGAMLDLGTLGGSVSYANGINNNGQVTGGSYTASGATHAFLYTSGAMQDLGTLGGDTSFAEGINDNGQVVGWSDTSDGTQDAFLYINGVMIDLNNLLPANSGWTLENAVAINDLGQIVGQGYNAATGQDDAFLLNIYSPLSVTAQPQSLEVNAFTTASFSVTATGTPPLGYQWSVNGTNIPGATSSTLTVSNVVQTNLGTYSVLVTSASGSTNSSNATLSMYPYLIAPFAGVDTYWGQTNTLSVGAWGTGPLSYQWFDNGNAIDSATNSTLTLSNIQFTNAGLYSVVVSSALGSVTNTPNQVIVNPANVGVQLCPNVVIQGTVGYNFIIQSTTNLADTNSWITQANLTLTQPVQFWDDTNTDVNQPSNPRKFYRVLPGQ